MVVVAQLPKSDVLEVREPILVAEAPVEQAATGGPREAASEARRDPVVVEVGIVGRLDGPQEVGEEVGPEGATRKDGQLEVAKRADVALFRQLVRILGLGSDELAVASGNAGAKRHFRWLRRTAFGLAPLGAHRRQAEGRRDPQPKRIDDALVLSAGQKKVVRVVAELTGNARVQLEIPRANADALTVPTILEPRLLLRQSVARISEREADQRAC